MSEAPILRVEKVDKVFTRTRKPSVEALRDINLSVNKGEFVSIVGASGSGKSTLLRIIDGLLKPSGGQIYVWTARRSAGRAGTGPWFSSRIRCCHGRRWLRTSPTG